MGKFAKIGAVIFLVVASASPAYAYIDPGSGAFILQILAALGAGLLFYFVQARNKIGAFFARFRKSRGGGFRKRKGRPKE